MKEYLKFYDSVHMDEALENRILKAAEDAPFFYTYEDAQGYTITLVVGYHGTLENFGTYTYIQKDGECFSDAGRNIFSNTKNREVYPWVEIMWEKLEIPWAVPGKDIDVDIVISDQG